ncbi:MAG: helix-turn-helix domain-containing protein [Planctomycetes bacterium]|nr:helix-turn-helix domain-containing protein [Planctomycetota bacterium]
MYSTKEAAEKLGLSPDHLRHLLLKGEIKGKKLGHDWVVLSLDYKRKRQPKRKKEVDNKD